MFKILYYLFTRVLVFVIIIYIFVCICVYVLYFQICTVNAAVVDTNGESISWTSFAMSATTGVLLSINDVVVSDTLAYASFVTATLLGTVVLRNNENGTWKIHRLHLSNTNNNTNTSSK